MFWVSISNYRVTTAAHIFDVPYECPECGTKCTARVAAQGTATGTAFYGARANEAAAMANAEADIRPAAVRALARSACPSCGRFAQAIIDQAEAAAGDSVGGKWRRACLIPTAAALSIGALGAAYDSSGWLALAAIGAVTTVAAGVLLAYAVGATPSGPIRQPSNVWFWHHETWVTPPVAYTPSKQPVLSHKTYGILAMIALAAGIGGALVGGISWFDTFAHLHVLDTDPAGGALTIWLDGKRVGTVPASTPGKDFGSDSFLIRAGHHHVAAYDEAGSLVEEFDFANPAGSDTVFAPLAREHEVCFGLVTAIYSDDAYQRNVPPPARLITTNIAEIPHPDVDWQDPPSSVEVDHGSTARRTALRAARCSADE